MSGRQQAAQMHEQQRHPPAQQRVVVNLAQPPSSRQSNSSMRGKRRSTASIASRSNGAGTDALSHGSHSIGDETLVSSRDDESFGIMSTSNAYFEDSMDMHTMPQFNDHQPSTRKAYDQIESILQSAGKGTSVTNENMVGKTHPSQGKGSDQRKRTMANNNSGNRRISTNRIQHPSNQQQQQHPAQPGIEQRSYTSPSGLQPLIARQQESRAASQAVIKEDRVYNHKIIAHCSFFHEISTPQESALDVSKQTDRGNDLVKEAASWLLETVPPHHPARQHTRVGKRAGASHEDSTAAEPIERRDFQLGVDCHGFESHDPYAEFYRHHFYKKDHQMFIGETESEGKVVISYRREITHRHTTLPLVQFRIIFRSTLGGTHRLVIPSTALYVHTDKLITPKDVLGLIYPSLKLSQLRLARIDPKIQDDLLTLDECAVNSRRQYKFGVLYCRDGQTTEEEAYSNKEDSQTFSSFLSGLGYKVLLDGFEKFNGGLDTNNDQTGTHSVYCEYRGAQIMYHVSTMLPHKDNDEQQVLKKRFIGNDIVTIVFMDEDAGPIDLESFCSKFLHVIIFVKLKYTENDECVYQISVARKSSVTLFSPDLPSVSGCLPASEATSFSYIIEKAINAEHSAYGHGHLAKLHQRTHNQLLETVVTTYQSEMTLSSIGKQRSLAKLIHIGGRKRGTTVFQGFAREAETWRCKVIVEGHINQRDLVHHARVGMSQSLFVVDDLDTESILHIFPCAEVVGWMYCDSGLRVWFGALTRDQVTIVCSEDDKTSIIVTLRKYTTGVPIFPVSLSRPHRDVSWGFSINRDHVTRVEEGSIASRANVCKNMTVFAMNGQRVATLESQELLQLSQQRENHLDLLVMFPQKGFIHDDEGSESDRYPLSVSSSRASSFRRAPSTMAHSPTPGFQHAPSIVRSMSVHNGVHRNTSNTSSSLSIERSPQKLVSTATTAAKSAMGLLDESNADVPFEGQQPSISFTSSSSDATKVESSSPSGLESTGQQQRRRGTGNARRASLFTHESLQHLIQATDEIFGNEAAKKKTSTLPIGARMGGRSPNIEGGLVRSMPVTPASPIEGTAMMPEAAKQPPRSGTAPTDDDSARFVFPEERRHHQQASPSGLLSNRKPQHSNHSASDRVDDHVGRILTGSVSTGDDSGSPSPTPVRGRHSLHASHTKATTGSGTTGGSGTHDARGMPRSKSATEALRSTALALTGSGDVAFFQPEDHDAELHQRAVSPSSVEGMIMQYKRRAYEAEMKERGAYDQIEALHDEIHALRLQLRNVQGENEILREKVQVLARNQRPHDSVGRNASEGALDDITSITFQHLEGNSTLSDNDLTLSTSPLSPATPTPAPSTRPDTRESTSEAHPFAQARQSVRSDFFLNLQGDSSDSLDDLLDDDEDNDGHGDGKEGVLHAGEGEKPLSSVQLKTSTPHKPQPSSARTRQTAAPHVAQVNRHQQKQRRRKKKRKDSSSDV